MSAAADQRAAVRTLGAGLSARRAAVAAAVRALAGIAAQSEATTRRAWRDLGARDVVVTGNLKFDVAIPPQQRRARRSAARAVRRDRPVLVLASTRDGEEALLLDALARADALPAATLVVIVPRHPQRFDAVAALLDERAACRTRAAARTRRSVRRRPRRARRFARRDVRLLRRVRRRVRRRQPAAARRPEPDRAHRRRRAHADRTAHVQFRGRRATRPLPQALRCGSAMPTKCSPSRRGCSPIAGERERMRARAQTFIAAHRGADRSAVGMARAAARALPTRKSTRATAD